MKAAAIVLLLSSALLYACRGDIKSKAEESMNREIIADKSKYTSIEWVDSIVNFGTIKMGEKATVRFRFRNTGVYPLYLVDVRAGCGCTVAGYTKGAIPPGREGEVTGEFDSNRSSPGDIRKSITVRANTRSQEEHTLIFMGEVRGFAEEDGL